MYSVPWRRPQPAEEWVTKSVPAYSFGAHTVRPSPKDPSRRVVLFYPKDNAVIDADPKALEETYHDPPAWLAADWLSMKQAGIPLSPFAQRGLDQALRHSSAVRWLATVKGTELPPAHMP